MCRHRTLFSQYIRHNSHHYCLDRPRKKLSDSQKAIPLLSDMEYYKCCTSISSHSSWQYFQSTDFRSLCDPAGNILLHDTLYIHLDIGNYTNSIPYLCQYNKRDVKKEINDESGFKVTLNISFYKTKALFFLLLMTSISN